MNKITRIFLTLAAFLFVIGLAGNITKAFGQPVAAAVQPAPPTIPGHFVIEATVTASADRPLSVEEDEIQASVLVTNQWGEFTIGWTSCSLDPEYPSQLCAGKDGVIRLDLWWLAEDTFGNATFSIEVWAPGRMVQRVSVPRPRNGLANAGIIKVPDAPVSLQVVGISSVNGTVSFTVFVHKIVPGPLPVVVRAYVFTAGGGEPWAEVELRLKKIPSSATLNQETGLITANIYTTEFEYSVKLPAYVPAGRFVGIRALVEDPADPFTRWSQSYSWTTK